ncbi:ribonuclease pancreatic-like [Dromiciops gliroides]|uniref:ribonuclease pancreatic-like n=1 Tax=Dromiciops gliroides TaxID=33562 RepID=UPI001CC6F68E|nr:ribonuclease pancreatic-like [Dromiciops gliroides]
MTERGNDWLQPVPGYEVRLPATNTTSLHQPRAHPHILLALQELQPTRKKTSSQSQKRGQDVQQFVIAVPKNEDEDVYLQPMIDSITSFAGSSMRELKFWREHHNERSSNEEVQKQMRQINSGKKKCKHVNTIIHDQQDKIKDICTNPNGINVPCKNRQDNCFEGPDSYSVTACEETGSSQLGKCHYTCTKKEPVKVTVACENGKPVHLEGTREIIHDEL